MDEVEPRQAIERQLNKIEHAHRFAWAVSVGNPREFIRIFFLDFRAKPHRCWIRGHFLFHL